MTLDALMSEATREGRCPHLAIVLPSLADVPTALAAFYALGVKRNGWLLHRALPGRAAPDRAGLVAAGLDVDALEREGRMRLDELPLLETPETWAAPWLAVLEEQLARGYDAVWWSRFPVGPSEHAFRLALEYDRAWDAAFAGRQAVSLCLYVVGDLPARTRGERVDALALIHDGVLVGAMGGSEAVLVPRVEPGSDVGV